VEARQSFEDLVCFSSLLLSRYLRLHALLHTIDKLKGRKKGKNPNSKRDAQLEFTKILRHTYLNFFL
jgi:hypothetical protein